MKSSMKIHSEMGLCDWVNYKKIKKIYQFQIPTNIILKKLIEKKNKSMTEG